ncbi:MAG TPA: substrate-binding domain-containing protein, partial [Dehalococcoidales bacterium]|nr:substrate-binding domain-containing protein [Dehalococcoidales bacterium]
MKQLLKSKRLLAAFAMAVIVVIMMPLLAFAAVVDQSPIGVVGTLKFQGSTTVGPIIVNTISSYNTHRGATVISAGNIVQNGSGDGRTAAAQRKTDIGMSSSVPSEPILNKITIARDGIVFIVNSSVTGIQNLTRNDIDDIYEGRKHNWNQIIDAVTGVAGPNMTIVPRARIIGSGTRAAWKDVVGLSYANPDIDPTYNPAWVPGTSTNENRVIAQTQLTRLNENVNVQSEINNPASVGQCGYVGLGFDDGANIKKINIF